jgi:hypothetical protein
MLDIIKRCVPKPVRDAARPVTGPVISGMYKARRGVSALDEWSGRALFGNTAGAKFNFAGQARLRRMARQANLAVPSHPLADELHREGCAHAPAFVDAARLKPIVEEVDRAMEDDSMSESLTNQFHKDHGVEAIRRITDPTKSIPSMAALVDEKLIAIVTAYYNARFTVLLAKPYRTYHIPPALVAQKEAIAEHWHCDVRRTDMLKIFILLRDTDETMGPLHVLSRSDTKEALRRGYRSRNDFGPAAEWMESRAKRHTGRAGDAMFANTTTCMHRASIPAPGKFRDMLEMRFLPALEGPAPDWMHHMVLNADKM